MNQDQITSAVRGALIALGPSIVALGIPNGAWQIALSLVPTLAGFVWSMFAHTETATAAAAADVKGLKVVVDDTASPALMAMAKDPNVRDVELAPSASVFESPYATSAKSSRAL